MGVLKYDFPSSWTVMTNGSVGKAPGSLAYWVEGPEFKTFQKTLLPHLDLSPIEWTVDTDLWSKLNRRWIRMQTESSSIKVVKLETHFILKEFFVSSNVISLF
jgi:hypothetical protein